MTMLKVIENPGMLDEVCRSWRERLFSRPWKPWRRTKMVPSHEVLIYGSMVVVHPEVGRELRAGVDGGGVGL
jgi:hypothetical protein